MTHPLTPLAPPAGAEAHETDGPDMRECWTCGTLFPVTRGNKEFCTEPCRRAFEAIIAPIVAAIRRGLRVAIKEVLRRRREGR